MFNFTYQEIQAITLSLKVGLFCTLFSLIPAVLTAYILARKEFYGKIFVESLINIPLVLPPVSIGYLLLLFFSKNNTIGKNIYAILGFDISLSIIGIILAASIMGFPLLVKTIKISIENIDKNLELCAYTLGINPLKVFFTITLPLAKNGIIAGLILSFARSLGEFGATITFVGNIEGKTQTLPMLIYSYSQTPDTDLQVNKLIIISILISFFSLFISEILSRKRFS